MRKERTEKKERRSKEFDYYMKLEQDPKHNPTIVIMYKYVNLKYYLIL